MGECDDYDDDGSGEVARGQVWESDWGFSDEGGWVFGSYLDWDFDGFCRGGGCRK